MIFWLLVSCDININLLSLSNKPALSGRDWVGLGFSDRGDLEGGDLCLLWRDWRGVARLQEVVVDTLGILQVEASQHCGRGRWRKLGGRRRQGEEQEQQEEEKDENGGLVFSFSRPWDTGEAGLYQVEEGTTHVVWAIGRGPLYSLQGLNVTDTSSVTGGMARVRLLTVEEEVGEEEEGEGYLVSNDGVSVPSSDTTYWCSTHRLEDRFSSKHHVLSYSPSISPGSEDLVHHMEVFHCVGQQDVPLWSGSCGDPAAPPALNTCKKVLAAWAIGAATFSYPPEAGLALGGPGAGGTVMLEVHYNNPGLRAGVVDSSGIRFVVTPKLRRHDAGILELGLTYNDHMAVPPLQPAFPLTGVCSAQCTSVGLPGGGIRLFGSQLHTHGAGRQVQTVLVRAGGGGEVVNRDPHYSSHFQEIRILPRQVDVAPGDALLTTCTYSTLDRSNVTLGGFSFAEEMCVNYVHYYPRGELEVGRDI